MQFKRFYKNLRLCILFRISEQFYGKYIYNHILDIQLSVMAPKVSKHTTYYDRKKGDEVYQEKWQHKEIYVSVSKTHFNI